MALVVRNQDTITFFSLSDPFVPSDLAHVVNEAIKLGYERIRIRLECDTMYPNCVVPVAALLYGLSERGLTFDWESVPKYADLSRMTCPRNMNEATSGDILSHLWAFDPESNTSEFLTTLRDALSDRVTIPGDTLWALEWALCEIMDNVIVHSGEMHGYVMAQVHPSSAQQPIAICVADLGLGLKNTLSAAYPKLKNDYDAITAAIRQGVTRDKTIGQGNGLWGLSRIVAYNKGRLAIRSGSARLYLDPAVAVSSGGRHDKFQFLGYERPGTSVDFQLNTDKHLDLRSILELPDAVNHRLEAVCDDRDFFRLYVRDQGGTGTRGSGERLRNRVLNHLEAGAVGAIVDFEDVGVITSSFADEFIGKMVSAMGFVQFSQKIRLVGLHELGAQIVNRAVLQRLAQPQTASTLEESEPS